MAKTTTRATVGTPIEWSVGGRINLADTGDSIDVAISGHAHSPAEANERVLEATWTILAARDAVLNPPAANNVPDPADPSGKDKVADPPGGRKAR